MLADRRRVAGISRASLNAMAASIDSYTSTICTSPVGSSAAAWRMSPAGRLLRSMACTTCSYCARFGAVVTWMIAMSSVLC